MNVYMMMPEVIKENSIGYIRSSIMNELFQKREIQCMGDITVELVYSLNLQLRYLQELDGEKEIVMHINSPGGEVASGLALYDTMQAISCPIRTVCEGTAASMAALLFISGDRREMLPHARVMIHDPLIRGRMGGNALQIERLSKDLMKMREVTAGIIAKHTGKTLEEVYEKTAIDSYFDAEECIEWGLADAIWKGEVRNDR